MRGARLGFLVASLVELASHTVCALARAQPAPPATSAPQGSTHPADRIAGLSGVDEARGRRVHRFLRELEGAIPSAIEAHHVRVRATTQTPDAGATAPPAGTDELYVVYQISSFEVCVRAAGGDDRRQLRAARESCRAEHGIRTKLAHVRIAPTPTSSRRDEGGEITLVGSAPLDIGLGDFELDHFDVGDIDGDGRLEVSVYVAEESESWDAGYRGMGATRTDFSERFLIFDEALRPQLALVVTSGFDYGHRRGGVEAVRRDREGGLVLVVYGVEVDCGQDQEANEDGECHGRRRIRLAYDAQADVHRAAAP